MDQLADPALTNKERHRARVLLRRMAMLAKRISERELAGNNASFDRSEYGALRWVLRRVAPESRFPSLYPLPAYHSCRRQARVPAGDEERW